MKLKSHIFYFIFLCQFIFIIHSCEVSKMKSKNEIFNKDCINNSCQCNLLVLFDTIFDSQLNNFVKPLYLYKHAIDNHNEIIDSVINNDSIFYFFKVFNIKNKFVEGELIGSVIHPLYEKYKSQLKTTKGWVKKESIVLYFSCYDTLILYKQPKYDSEKIKIPQPILSPVKVINCQNNWAFIKYENKKLSQIVYGWLAPENQCTNPFTTCN